MRIATGLLIAMAYGAQQPMFDASSVKAVDLASHPTFGNSGGPGTSDPGRIHLCCVGMYSLLMRAYDVQIDQISGPSWMMDNMGPNLYQVDATMPAGTGKAQYQIMMQNLLAERFHLAIHRETHKFPGYELVVAKDGPKLKVSKPDPNVTPEIRAGLGRGMIRVQVQQKTLQDVVSSMGRWIEQSMGGDFRDFESPKPRVVDKTGLAGKYDFTLEFVCDSCRNGIDTGDQTPSGLPTIFSALEKQLGLKLVKTGDVPLEIIVVDHVDKIPTEN